MGDHKMNQELQKAIKEAYEIAHENNESGHNRTRYTRSEAIQYDPLISKLYQVIKLLEIKNG